MGERVEQREVEDGLRGRKGVERVRSCWGAKGDKSTEDLKVGSWILTTVCQWAGRPRYIDDDDLIYII